MKMARVLKTGSSEALCLAIRALTDSASIRAWAGSYTPHGRSQWASTTVGRLTRSATARRRGRMRISRLLVGFGIVVTLPTVVARRGRRGEGPGGPLGAAPAGG